MLSEAMSNHATDREEVKVKEMQQIDVDKAYTDFVKKCCERVKCMMFQDKCAFIIVVRNVVLETSSDWPGQEFVDCEVDNWVVKKCTVECDDRFVVKRRICLGPAP